MGTFFAHLITSIVTIAVIAAMAWVGAPMVYQHIAGLESAVQTLKADAAARSAETVAANAHQANCVAEVRAATAAGAAIAKASQPQPEIAGRPRPMIGADQIRAFMQ